MPWSETSPMDQKTQFIADYLRETLSVTELCERYGISRKTAYKWIDRYLRHAPRAWKIGHGDPVTHRTKQHPKSSPRFSKYGADIRRGA